MSLIATIFVLITLYVLIKRYFKHRYSFWVKQNVPGYDYFDTRILKRDIIVHEIDVEDAKKFGPVYGRFEFFRSQLIINEPEMIREVFVKDFTKFPDHRGIYFGEDSINLNMFNLPGNDDWKRIRNLSSPAFTSAKLKNMVLCMDEITNNFINNLNDLFDKNNKPVELEIREYLGAFLADVINSTAFGIKSNAIKNPNQPIVEFGKNLFAIDSKLSLIISVTLPKVAKFLRLEPFSGAAIKYFRDLTHELIRERNQRSDKDSKNKRNDFLQLMIDANKNSNQNTFDTNGQKDEYDVNESFRKILKPTTGQTLNTTEMTAQCVLFFLAGFDTTGSSLAHCLYYLAKYQDIQQKVFDELEFVTDFTADSLASLQYLDAVISETLRLCPPFLRVERVSHQDHTFTNPKIFVPAGSVLSVTPYTLHRDARFYPDPEQFKPERFLGDGQQLTHSYAYMPFGAGPRLCLGQRLALIQMRICVTKLVKNFRLKLSPNTKLDYPKGNIFFSPREVKLILEKRN